METPVLFTGEPSRPLSPSPEELKVPLQSPFPTSTLQHVALADEVADHEVRLVKGEGGEAAAHAIAEVLCKAVPEAPL